MIPVSLSDLVGEMQMLSDEVHGYLNQVTGEIAIIMQDDISVVEREEDFSNRQAWEQEAYKKT
jgi:hypothetical protein